MNPEGGYLGTAVQIVKEWPIIGRGTQQQPPGWKYSDLLTFLETLLS
jgi:hypothetical protein